MSESDGRVGVAGRADSAETHLNPVAGFIFAEVSGSVVREDGNGRERMVADVFEGRTSFHREIGQFGFGGERQVSDQDVIGLSNKQTGQSCYQTRCNNMCTRLNKHKQFDCGLISFHCIWTFMFGSK